MGLETGLLLGERFRLVNRLSRGRFGELWRGADRVPTRPIAIRVVGPPTSEAEAWFEELRATRALRHRNVAQVLGVGRTGDDAASPVWIASELLVGETLMDLLDRRGTLPVGAALQLCADLAEALAEAHARGIVHQAIDPRSIILHRENDGTITAKLVDFGRGRWLAATAPLPLDPYRCPTVVAGDRRVDPSLDIWALGVLLVRCVSGRPPLSAQSEVAFVAQARRLGEALEALIADERVRRVAAACLSASRGDRPDAARLADRARCAASIAVGGWSALERMARVPDAYLDADRYGVIDHWPTIPGVAPSRASSLPPAFVQRAEPTGVGAPCKVPIALPATEDAYREPEGEEEDDAEQPYSIPLLPGDQEIPPTVPRSIYLTPTPADPFVDFRPSPWRGRAAAAAAVCAAFVVALVASREDPRLRRIGLAIGKLPAAHAAARPPADQAGARPASEPVVAGPTPNPAVGAAQPASVVVAAPTKQKAKVQLAAAPPGRSEAKEARAKATVGENTGKAKSEKTPSSGAAPIPMNAGIPLWDGPKKKKETIKNPYE
ncbi:MAG: protein kinase [Deltaproteobacteria bacterium]|nr:protein kinase [Deltaproteobacteria bacterium]